VVARRILTQAERELIQANTADDAAKLLKTHRSTIAKLCKREGISFKRIYNAGDNEMRGINKKIRQARKDGLSVKAIMDLTGVTAAKVRQLLNMPNKGKVFTYLDEATTEWLEAQCPEGMGLQEFIAVIVTDAYLEDQE
jgi:IS30 family transposase